MSRGRVFRSPLFVWGLQMKNKKILIVFISGVLLAGCSFTRNNSQRLDCVPDKSGEKVYQIKQRTKININVVDKRKIDNQSSIIGHYGPGRRMINTVEKPVSNIVKSFICDGLHKMNFDVVDKKTSRYVLNCNINNVGFGGEEKGIASLSTTTKISLHCYLYDNKTHKILWQERIVGAGQQNSRFLWLDKERRASFCFALTDLVKKIQKSQTFRDVFER